MNTPQIDKRPGWNQSIATGTGYRRPKSSYDTELIETGPGTPMGEVMRRYWQPVALSHEVSDDPVKVKVLDEDLIVFRDKLGGPASSIIVAAKGARRFTMGVSRTMTSTAVTMGENST